MVLSAHQTYTIFSGNTCLISHQVHANFSRKKNILFVEQILFLLLNVAVRRTHVIFRETLAIFLLKNILFFQETLQIFNIIMYLAKKVIYVQLQNWCGPTIKLN